MKKSIMKKWVRALRSGKFKQGLGRLETPDGTNCCLGVLCNLALVEGICDYDSFDGYQYFDNRSGTLPISVREWAGIKSYVGRLTSINTDLTTLNDSGGHDFNQIADIIEKHYKEL